MNGMKLLLVTATILMAASLSSCTPRSEHSQVEPVKAQPDANIINLYRQEISGLSQIGVTVTGDEFPLATEDSAKFNAVVADLEKRINVDTAIEGTKTSGQRAELLNALKDSASKNAPYIRAAEMNKQTETKLKNHMLATGPASLRESAVQQTVISRKGTDAWLKLYEIDDTGLFNQKVEELFPG